MDYSKLLRKVIRHGSRHDWFSPELADDWDSMLINRRKPVTCRMMRQYGKYRVCLHRFNPCYMEDAFPHPHPWPGAFMVVSGGYELFIGRSNSRMDGPPPMQGPIFLTPGSLYVMDDPNVWHIVRPIKLTHTIMVNGPRYADDIRHEKAPTTQGKQLKELDDTTKMEMLQLTKSDLYGSMAIDVLIGHPSEEHIGGQQSLEE